MCFQMTGMNLKNKYLGTYLKNALESVMYKIDGTCMGSLNTSIYMKQIFVSLYFEKLRPLMANAVRRQSTLPF